MATVVAGVQVERGPPQQLDQHRDPRSGVLYSVLITVSQPIRLPMNEEFEILGDDVPPSAIIEALENAGHFEYLAGKEEDIYTQDDGQGT